MFALGWSPIVAVLGLGLCFALALGGQRILSLPWGGYAVPFTLIALATLAGWEIVRHVATRPAPLAVVPFLIVSTTAGLAIRLAYVTYIQPEWYTDFERYWIYGLKLANGELAEVTNGYARRANFLTRPLIELFGPVPHTVAYSNALVLTAIHGIGYDVLRRLRSHQAAQSFSILWLLTPIPLMTATVPNHDLLGLLLICTALWLTVVGLIPHGSKANDRATLVACNFLAGVFIALLEAVRGLGTIYILCFALIVGAVLAVSLLRGRSHIDVRTLALRGVAALAILVVASMCTEAALRYAGAMTPSESEQHSRLLYTTPHATSLSDGTYNFKYAYDKAFMESLGEDLAELRSLRNASGVTDLIVSPGSRLQSTLAKMRRMFALGSEQSFYLRGVEGIERQAITAYNVFFGTVFGAVLLLAIIRLVRHPPGTSLLESFLLLLTSTVTASLLIIGENQPRYISMIWFSGAVAIASYGYLPSRAARSAPQSATILFVRSALIILSLCAGIRVLAAVSTSQNDGRTLYSWTYSTDLDADTATFFEGLRNHRSEVLIGRNGSSLPRHFGPLAFNLALPPDSTRVSAETRICGLDNSAALSFYFHVGDADVRGSTPASAALLVNGLRRWSAPLAGTERPQFIRRQIDPDNTGCAHIRFQLIGHEANGNSGRRVAEFFFPKVSLESSVSTR